MQSTLSFGDSQAVNVIKTNVDPFDGLEANDVAWLNSNLKEGDGVIVSQVVAQEMFKQQSADDFSQWPRLRLFYPATDPAYVVRNNSGRIVGTLFLREVCYE